MYMYLYVMLSLLFKDLHTILYSRLLHSISHAHLHLDECKKAYVHAIMRDLHDLPNRATTAGVVLASAKKLETHLVLVGNADLRAETKPRYTEEQEQGFNSVFNSLSRAT